MGNPFDEINSRFDRLDNLILSLIKEIKKSHLKKDEEDLMDINEAAKFIKKAKQTVYKYSSDGLIPLKKKQGKLYFSKKELTKWIESGKKKTVAELKDEVDFYNLYTRSRPSGIIKKNK